MRLAERRGELEVGSFDVLRRSRRFISAAAGAAPGRIWPGAHFPSADQTMTATRAPSGPDIAEASTTARRLAGQIRAGKLTRDDDIRLRNALRDWLRQWHRVQVLAGLLHDTLAPARTFPTKKITAVGSAAVAANVRRVIEQVRTGRASEADLKALRLGIAREVYALKETLVPQRLDEPVSAPSPDENRNNVPYDLHYLDQLSVAMRAAERPVARMSAEQQERTDRWLTSYGPAGLGDAMRFSSEFEAHRGHLSSTHDEYVEIQMANLARNRNPEHQAAAARLIADRTRGFHA
jgi:hypothetical protein